MNILKFIFENTDVISKRILRIYRVVITYMLIFIGLSVLLNENIFSDYTTAVYWLNELLLCAVNITKAFVIPVLLYEIMRTYFSV